MTPRAALEHRGVSAVVFGLSLISGAGVVWAAEPSPGAHAGAALMTELGCAHCHQDARIPSTLRVRTPDLSTAGLRYQPAYLFEFLRNPARVRRHLGRARMPDFHLTERETVSLVLFLGDQQGQKAGWPELPEALTKRMSGVPRKITEDQFQSVLRGGLACLGCHTWEGQGGTIGIELSNVGWRLRKEWLPQYLADPAMFGVPKETMPPQFYQTTDGTRPFQEIVPEAAEKIGVLADYIFSLYAERRAALESRYAAARAAFPGATAVLGEGLFRAFHCAACHRMDGVSGPAVRVAPDLALESERVAPAWLEAYLKQPSPIRPFGYRPGDGSRMPDFRLSQEEASSVAGFLSVRPPSQAASREAFVARRLSAFSMRKARALMTEKWSCLGCHRLGGEGGRIGPDLGAVAGRLRPDHVYQVIRDPRATVPHSGMPRSFLSETSVGLLVGFLMQHQEPARENRYVSPLDSPLIPWVEPSQDQAAAGATVRARYLALCASCHGNEGEGNGFNAPQLPAAPARHADAGFMARRPDDTLFDGIHSGGGILGKSPRMPAWGGTLAPAEIRELVEYLRALCRCHGPEWARD